MHLQELAEQYPIVAELAAAKETLWSNPSFMGVESLLTGLPFGLDELEDARLRLERFRPFIVRAFPETASRAGLIESDLVFADSLHQGLNQHFSQDLPGRLLIKLDSHLPVSGSIKARGGIYEVLKTAETMAFSHNFLGCEDDYAKLATPKAMEFFSRFSLSVGSTGNLGLSVGIMGSTLGLKVTVHMSADAREWKKQLLREHGVDVREYQGDYSQAVAQGRAQALNDPFCHFIDDEHSLDLFLGYATAGDRLAQQLDELGILVDADHPLFCHLPCGVGGGPGGLSFGLKCALGDHVHCIFAEPTLAPAMLLGLATGRHDEISVADIGLVGKTAADGLAVGRASGFVGKTMGPWIDGVYTVSDENLFRMLAIIAAHEGYRLEPSAVAGFPGPWRIMADEGYLEMHGLKDRLAEATHILWATGGSMVPDEELDSYGAKGKTLL